MVAGRDRCDGGIVDSRGEVVVDGGCVGRGCVGSGCKIAATNTNTVVDAGVNTEVRGLRDLTGVVQTVTQTVEGRASSKLSEKRTNTIVRS